MHVKYRLFRHVINPCVHGILHFRKIACFSLVIKASGAEGIAFDFIDREFGCYEIRGQNQNIINLYNISHVQTLNYLSIDDSFYYVIQNPTEQIKGEIESKISNLVFHILIRSYRLMLQHTAIHYRPARPPSIFIVPKVCF